MGKAYFLSFVLWNIHFNTPANTGKQENNQTCLIMPHRTFAMCQKIQQTFDFENVFIYLFASFII